MERLLLLLMILMAMGSSVESQLRNGFYSSSCPKAEAIVRATVQAYFQQDPTIAAGLLRLHFHDCFVQGCDGSVLISGPSAERASSGSVGLRGFEVIDNAKLQLEATCPGVVSCADILALATRDGVALSNGPNWVVPTGRRDGRISSASLVTTLPSPLDPIAVIKNKFAAKGLGVHDLVTLIGAHSIGHTDCNFFRYRLYNYSGGGNPDPKINRLFLAQLQSLCPKDGDGTKKVALDKDSLTGFDVNIYKNIQNGNGVLESDQRLWDDFSTRYVVRKYASTLRGFLGLRFKFQFSRAMIKMSSVEVKTGIDGEIRKLCSRIN